MPRPRRRGHRAAARLGGSRRRAEPDTVVFDAQQRDEGDGWSWRRVLVGGSPAVYGEVGDGPPVVFLHGWGLDPRVYKPGLARLASARARVVAPALPGFGGTAALTGHPWSISGFGAWVAEFLDALGISERALVMGHSFGGGVSIALCHDHPDRVRSLVLINSIGASAWSRRGVMPRTMAQRPLWDWGLRFPADLWPLGQARRIIPAVFGEAIGNLVRDPLSVVKAADLARRADLRRELEELKRRRLPVVVLWGSRDQLITRDAFEEMCELLGRPQAVTVEGSHGWLIADPDAFAEVVTNVVDIAARSRLRPRRPSRRLRSLVRRVVRLSRGD